MSITNLPPHLVARIAATLPDKDALHLAATATETQTMLQPELLRRKDYATARADKNLLLYDDAAKAIQHMWKVKHHPGSTLRPVVRGSRYMYGREMPDRLDLWDDMLTRWPQGMDEGEWNKLRLQRTLELPFHGPVRPGNNFHTKRDIIKVWFKHLGHLFFADAEPFGEGNLPIVNYQMFVVTLVCAYHSADLRTRQALRRYAAIRLGYFGELSTSYFKMFYDRTEAVGWRVLSNPKYMQEAKNVLDSIPLATWQAMWIGRHTVLSDSEQWLTPTIQ